MVHTYNHNTQETEVGETQAQPQPGLPNEFKASLGFYSKTLL